MGLNIQATKSLRGRNLIAINRELSVKLAQEIVSSLFYFDKEILGYSKMEEDVHMPMCEFMDERYLPEGQDTYKPFKMLLLPRGGFKTSAVTIGYAIQQIILNPNIRILIANENFNNSKRFASEIRGHFEGNELLRQSYGDYVGKKDWREDYFTVSKRTKNLKEPTISCAGIDVVKVGMHYDIIICDDLVSQNNVTTKEQMDKVIDFYKLALSLLEPDGEFIVIGTRWHFNDLYNHLIENEGDVFNFLTQSAIEEDGSLWFASRLTKEFLDGRKKSQGSYIFACQYLNNPVDDETAIFKKSWIHNFSIHQKLLIPDTNQPNDKVYRLEDCNVYLTIDPAISQQKHADSTGMCATAVDPQQRKFVVHAKKYKIQPKEMIDEIFRLWELYNAIQIGLEVSVFQIMLKDYLLNEMRARKKYLPIVELKPVAGKKKETRIRSLQPEFENGMIFIKPEMVDLEDELLRFPVGQHDDIIDALAYQTGMWFAPTMSKKSEIPVGSFDWVRNKILKKNKNPYYIGQNNNYDRLGINDGWY